MPRYIDADALKHELCIRQHMLNADSLWKTLERYSRYIPTIRTLKHIMIFFKEWYPLAFLPFDNIGGGKVDYY